MCAYIARPSTYPLSCIDDCNLQVDKRPFELSDINLSKGTCGASCQRSGFVLGTRLLHPKRPPGQRANLRSRFDHWVRSDDETVPKDEGSVDACWLAPLARFGTLRLSRNGWIGDAASKASSNNVTWHEGQYKQDFDLSSIRP